MNDKIKVLITDDSVLFREALAKGLSGDPDIEIVAKASDAFQARDMIIKFRPDVMTCDIEMPKMNGIEFVKKLIPQYPLPVIIISSASNSVFDAINAGAVDFMAKPDIITPAGMAPFTEELKAKIKSAAKAKVRRHPLISGDSKNENHRFDESKVIAIGASTGGTEALYGVLKGLPSNIPGIVIVQHIPPVFSKMFADRMDAQTALNVREAQGNETIEPGYVYIAPGDKHLRVRRIGSKLKTEVFAGEKVNGHCPSADVLFSSVAKECGRNAVGVILTGMGHDGAQGLLEMRKAGADTIGQDEKTSVVYGMPKVAYTIGAVEKQLSLYTIPDAVISASKHAK